MKVLVTGGAGYVGSHVVQQLVDSGHKVVVVDNLSSGHASAVLNAELQVLDLADTTALAKVMAGGFDAVMHFAAHVAVPESVQDPLKYYANNTFNTAGLLRVCVDHGIGQFILSSTAAVYGDVGCEPVPESANLSPINPYGASKMMCERILQDVACAHPLRFACLRYFNVAGADPQGRIGQSTVNATHLIKVACEVAIGRRAQMAIFGTDYATRDGTCIRDFIHVADLAGAHVAALEYLQSGGANLVLNCGYGSGFSVREVIATVEQCSGRRIRVTNQERRPGDAAVVIADARRIREELNWRPRYADLSQIVQHALAWELRLAGGG